MVASTYKVLIENTPDGQALATILEFPDCHATATTSEEAISRVRTRLTDRLSTAEIISIQIPAKQSQNPWVEFAGVFKDDPEFAAIAKAIRNERVATEDEESI